MLNKLFLPGFFIVLLSCSKNNSDSKPHVVTDPILLPVISGFTPASAPVDSTVTINGAHFNPVFSKNIVKFNGTTAVVKSGTDVQLLVVVPSGASTGKISVSVDTNTAISADIFTVAVIDQWILKSSLPGLLMQSVVSFKIGNKLFVGMGKGMSGSGNRQEFWQYDVIADVWTQKASFPGISAPGYAVGFAIGEKGYIVMEPDSMGRPTLWQYDTVLDSWKIRAPFPGNFQLGIVAFGIDNFGYAGLGIGAVSSNKDFWQYDPQADHWVKKSDYPGTATYYAASFVVGNFAYVGTGMNGFNTNSGSKEFYQYDPQTDVWKKKIDFPGPGRSAAAGFSIGDYGYFGTGNDVHGFYLNDFWQYNPLTDQWTRKKDFGGGLRSNVSAFNGTNQGYFGFGFGEIHQLPGSVTYSNFYVDVWQYQP